MYSSTGIFKLYTDGGRKGFKSFGVSHQKRVEGKAGCLNMFLNLLSLFTLADAFEIASFARVSDTVGQFTASLASEDNFGSAVVGLGDLNGDDVVDVAVGASQISDGGSMKVACTYCSSPLQTRCCHTSA